MMIDVEDLMDDVNADLLTRKETLEKLKNRKIGEEE